MKNKLTFTQTKAGFEAPVQITYNNNVIDGEWLIRKTGSGKMWVLEYRVNNAIYLPAQQVYNDENVAMELATNCLTSFIEGAKGKWQFNEINDKSKSYVVNRIPESTINWA